MTSFRIMYTFVLLMELALVISADDPSGPENGTFSIHTENVSGVPYDPIQQPDSAAALSSSSTLHSTEGGTSIWTILLIVLACCVIFLAFLLGYHQQREPRPVLV